MSGGSRTLAALGVKIFADGADIEHTRKAALNPLIKGFTTNPTLMRQAGVENYRRFAEAFLEVVPELPVSFEVLADDHAEMARQARAIQSWGRNVYVKIPVTNTKGESSLPLVRTLAADGVQVNVTAIFTLDQVRATVDALQPDVPSFVSVFAGRIADAGRDPVPVMAESVGILRAAPAAELIWASPREVLNVVQADDCGCHVITVTDGLLSKLHLIGKDLDEFSLETVAMFYNDAAAAGYSSDEVVAKSAA